ncbi:MAG TPA: helix-turn-helix domain-containing protein [Candidatus Merdisoma merdipullorum]|nr:helix-turn-helix domain-containing protein [Candidatus Merdisoma merdipullorum]
MSINRLIQQSLNHVKAAARTELCVLDTNGMIVATTLNIEKISKEIIENFICSQVESQVFQGYYFFKIFEEGRLRYILISKGGDSYAMGKLEAAQIETLVCSGGSRPDKKAFFKNLLLDEAFITDIYIQAKRLHVRVEIQRTVYLIEFQNERSAELGRILNEFADKTRNDVIVELDERTIAFIRESHAGNTEGSGAETARLLVDLLNSEAMIQVRIGYSRTADNLKELSKAYKEARTAILVGEIFYPDNTVCAYESLGLGRLIYQLPMSLCEMYIKEVFGEQKLESLDKETLNTIKIFFKNNLNVSETARQLYTHRNTLVYRLERIQKKMGLDIRVFEDAMMFRIGMLVDAYMKYMSK